MTWIQKSPECTRVLEYFSKVPELVSILICDLEESKQANLAKNPLGGTGAGEALFRTVWWPKWGGIWYFDIPSPNATVFSVL